MTGDEALALQGFDYIRQVKANGTQVFTHAQKFDFAGNAFNGYIVGALAMYIISLADWGHARHVRNQLRGMPRMPAVTAANDGIEGVDEADNSTPSDYDASVVGGSMSEQEASEVDAFIIS